MTGRDLTPEEWNAFHDFKDQVKDARRSRERAKRQEKLEHMQTASGALHARGVMLPLSRKHSKMATINDWARDMGIKLTPSMATRLGKRCARMYRAMYGKPPRMRRSFRKEQFYLDKYLKRQRVPSAFMVQVAVYPRLLIERAWAIVMTEVLRTAEEVDNTGKSNLTLHSQ
jgi:hypothetical protein